MISVEGDPIRPGLLRGGRSIKSFRAIGSDLRIRSALRFVGAATLLALVSCEQAPVQPTPTMSLDQQLLVQGRTVYEDYCITCHGKTGAGIEEARSRFPESHQTCERCHYRSLPRTPQDLGESFSIGHPPALKGLSDSGRFASRISVYSLIRAAMPSCGPGRPSDEE